MLRVVLRIAAGLVALLALAQAGFFWFAPAAAAAKMGLSALGPLGLASLRADNAGAFAATGVLALLGAVKGDQRLFAAPLLFVTLALIGRVITLAISGPSADLYPPMAIEAVLIVLFAACRYGLAPRTA